MSIIGLAGRKSVGKDTAAMILTQQGYQVVKFAGALKEMLRAYFVYVGVSDAIARDLIEGYRFKAVPNRYLCDKTPRFAMQTLGTEWGRDIMGENLWVNAAIAKCRQQDKSVITDVRFPNEVSAVKAQGGKIVLIKRDLDRSDTHASENFIDTLDRDYEIDNNGTIEELHQQILKLI